MHAAQSCVVGMGISWGNYSGAGWSVLKPAARCAPGRQELPTSSREGRGARPPALNAPVIAGGGSSPLTSLSVQHELLWELCTGQGLAGGCWQGTQRPQARC